MKKIRKELVSELCAKLQYTRKKKIARKITGIIDTKLKTGGFYKKDLIKEVAEKFRIDNIIATNYVGDVLKNYPVQLNKERRKEKGRHGNEVYLKLKFAPI